MAGPREIRGIEVGERPAMPGGTPLYEKPISHQSPLPGGPTRGPLYCGFVRTEYRA